MNITSETAQRPFRETGLKWIAGSSAVEAIAALAVVALAIVGLAGILSQTVAAIATIIMGAAILTQGGAFAASSMTLGTAYESQLRDSGGSSASFLGGISGIVLGILALLGIEAPTLMAVAVIVFGATFLLGGASPVFVSSGQTTGSELGASVSGGQIMVGLGALVMGILAVVGLAQWTLILVGLLCLGAAALFSGSWMGARSMSAAVTH